MGIASICGDLFEKCVPYTQYISPTFFCGLGHNIGVNSNTPDYDLYITLGVSLSYGFHCVFFWSSEDECTQTKHATMLLLITYMCINVIDRLIEFNKP